MDELTPPSPFELIGDELYSSLLQLSPDAIALLAPDMTYLMANQQAVHLHGYDSLDELVGRSGTDFIHPDEVERVPLLLEQLLRDGTIKGVYLRLLRKDGTSFPSESSASLVRAPSGAPRFIIMIARDISDRLRMEEELKAQQSRVTTILATSQDGYLQVGVDGRVLEVNDAYCRMVGYSRDELLAMSVNQLEVGESEEDIRARIARIMEQGSDLFLACHRRKDGSVVMLEACMNHNPAVAGLTFGFVRDITERLVMEESLRRSEERYRLLFEENPAPMWVYDLQTLAFLDVNRAAVITYGFSRQEFLAMTIKDIRPAEDVPRLLDEVSTVKTGLDRAGTWRHLKKDGSIFSVEIISFAINYEGRGAELVMALDVTDRIKAEEENRRLKEELEERVEQRTAQLAQSNRELESFCYTVSHDLRTPLRAIAGFSSLLREKCEGTLDAEGQHSLQRIELGAMRLGELIDDLLALSRVSRHEMTLKPVDLSALCGDIISHLAETHEGRRVEVRIEPEVTVMADPVLMRQALHNLLENAWKYTSRTSEPLIEFTCRLEGGYQVCSIRDNGAGFDMAYADKLFGTFQRLHGIDEFEGTGIGLATVKRAIERHGGRVWGEGKPGEGATFSFSLPHRTD